MRVNVSMYVKVTLSFLFHSSPSVEHRNRIGLIKCTSTGTSSPGKSGARDTSVPASSTALLAEELVEDEDEEYLTKEETTGDGESIVRPSMTSDYDSSNESPNDYDIVSDGSRDSSCETRDFTRKCMICGHRNNEAINSDPKAVWPNIAPGASVRENRDHHGRFIVKDGLAYDLDELTVDPLLNLISEWDYPIFELREAAGDAILSEISYRIFYEAGLLEAFKIPLQEFLNYFRALECGYKEKPCKAKDNLSHM